MAGWVAVAAAVRSDVSHEGIQRDGGLDVDPLVKASRLRVDRWREDRVAPAGEFDIEPGAELSGPVA